MFAFPVDSTDASRRTGCWYRSLPGAALAALLAVLRAPRRRERRRAPGRSESPVPRSRPQLRGARRRSRLADDARGEGRAAHERRARDPAPGRARLRVVERSAARRRPRGRGHRVPAGDRPGGHLRRAADARGRDRHQRRGARQAPRVRAARPARPLPGPHVLVAEHQHLPRPALGPRARRPTARIRTSPRAWASRSSKGLQGDDPKYLQGRRRPPSTSPCTAVRRRTGTTSTRVRASATSTRPTCPRSRPWSRKRKVDVGDGRLQPRQRRVGLGAASACCRTSCAGTGASTGYVVSDCGAIDDIYKNHKIVATAEEAAALGSQERAATSSAARPTSRCRSARRRRASSPRRRSTSRCVRLFRSRVPARHVRPAGARAATRGSRTRVNESAAHDAPARGAWRRRRSCC